MLLMLTLMVGCKSGPREAIPLYNVEAYVTNFIGKHPGWSLNAVRRREVCDTLRKKLETDIVDSCVLCDFPVRLSSVQSSEKLPDSLIVANFSPALGIPGRISYNMDIAAIVPSAFKNVLKEGEVYKITKYGFKKFMGLDYKYYMYSAYSPLVEVNGSDDDYLNEITLGIILLRADSIKSFTNDDEYKARLRRYHTDGDFVKIH